MNGNLFFLVEPYGGSNFVIKEDNIIVNVSIEDASFTNRLGVVKFLPTDYKGDIKVGDILVVHHNVFRTYYDQQGNKKESFNHIKDNLFFVEKEKIYMVIKEDGEQIAFENNVFVEPIVEQASFFEMEKEVERVGKIYLSNDSLKKEGIDKGDLICFANDSEYGFIINKKRLYKMTTNRILATV